MKKTVEIHKADISLLDGESLDQFQRSLRDSLVKKFGKRPTTGNMAKAIEVWPREVFSERVVFEKWTPGESGEKLFVATYKRDGANGEFSFEEPVPVREQRNYVPVSKAKEDPVEVIEVDTTKGLWDGLPLK